MQNQIEEIVSYTLSFQLKDDYIQTNVDGVRNSDTLMNDTLDALFEISRYANRFDRKKIFIMWNVVGETSRESAIEVLSELEHIPINKEKIIAFCFDSQANFQNNQLIEKLALQIGWKIKFFSESLIALRWLLNTN